MNFLDGKTSYPDRVVLFKNNRILKRARDMFTLKPSESFPNFVSVQKN